MNKVSYIFKLCSFKILYFYLFIRNDSTQ
ncbi:unnamed protein product [Spirodela intermedia]|uniref:Uncharacterized protein n=2 Tax=Spirodela intermedia TaxID=51605 RepID=A0A7I8KCS2_SPIIN|nr:unnamed protein product [Spirodela intermedia]CAA6659280.1 unnamed protein product [Spirodela intermedia]CAA7395589.1 unnamed protein product [Spirodela intermedia]